MSQSTLVELAPGRFAHASGALWLPGEGVALVADIHLGYGWALRRRGQLGPVQDAGARRKLLGVIEELRPRRLVVLGDLVHAPRPAAEERAYIDSVLQEAAAAVDLALVAGNHDRGFARDFPDWAARLTPEWRMDGIRAIHGDRIPAPGQEHLVMGHFHPALGVVDDAGASQRVPVFLTGERATVLPAFSPLAAGYDVRSTLPPDLAACLGKAEPFVIAATGRRVIRLGGLGRLRLT